jgi:hypothetical protein
MDLACALKIEAHENAAELPPGAPAPCPSRCRPSSRQQTDRHNACVRRFCEWGTDTPIPHMGVSCWLRPRLNADPDSSRDWESLRVLHGWLWACRSWICRSVGPTSAPRATLNQMLGSEGKAMMPCRRNCEPVGSCPASVLLSTTEASARLLVREILPFGDVIRKRGTRSYCRLPHQRIQPWNHA